jgi:YD repeat-containing protein
MAYTIYDASKPASTQTGTQFADSSLANGRALRDAIITGQMEGFILESVSGGTAAEPTTMVWYNATATDRIRAQITWGTTGGSDGQITQIIWAFAASGTDYTTSPGGTIATQTFSYDASGNLTATTAAGGFVSWLMSYMGKFTQHAAKTGAAAHGLGTISTQSAAAVAITGGTASGLAISSSSASLTYEREAKVSKGSISGSTAIDWAAGGLQTLTVTGAGATLTHSNVPSGVVGYVTLDVINGGLATSLLTGCKFAGGSAPSLTASGRDVISLMAHDGSTISVVGVVKDVR